MMRPYPISIEFQSSCGYIVLRCQPNTEALPLTVLAEETMLTTKAAADALNVSRQYLVRLVDSGRLPAAKVGAHRRIRASDVEAFKAARDGERDAALDRLVSLSEDMGGYALSPVRGPDVS